MLKSDIQAFVRKLLQESRYAQALEAMQKYSEGRDSYVEDDIVLLISSFNRNQRDYGRGILDDRERERNTNRLVYNITQLLAKLPEKGNEVDVGATHQTAEKRPEARVTHIQEAASNNILFLSGRFGDYSKDRAPLLNINDEMRDIKTQLSLGLDSNRFQFILEPSVTFLDFTRFVIRHKPKIIHFSGHGNKDAGLMTVEEGKPDYIGENRLRELFRLAKEMMAIDCVVLNACYASNQAKIISAEDIYVIGMSGKIGDTSARKFAAGFYLALSEGLNTPLAFRTAKLQIADSIKYADMPELWHKGEKLD